MKVGFVNGKIYVSFKPKRVEEAMLVENNKIVKVGKSIEIEKLSEKIVDLNGKTVLPGFIDAHLHLDEIGQFLNILDLRNVKSIEEMKKKLKEFAENSSGPIMGHGWDQEMFEEKRWPTRYDIDDVVDDRPVLLTRVCLHAAVVNTKMLELVDYKKEGENFPYENNEPLGIVKEEVFELFRKKFNRMIPEDIKKKMVEQAMDHVLSNGITSVGFVSVSDEIFNILKKINDEGKLRLRVFAYMNKNSKLKSMEINEKLKIKGIKLFADGSLGARTAYLTEMYSDEKTYGQVVEKKENIEKIIRDKDGQIAIHAIGDGGIDFALDIAKVYGNVRIEHASVMRDDQLDLAKKLNLTLVVQPHFIISDFWIIDRVGKERMKWVYRFRDMVERGINVAFSTDSPVEPVNPWLTIYAAMTRGKYEKLEIFNYTENQCLDLEESLYCYTMGSAKALQEYSIGSLEEGKFADFIILERDPFDINDPEELKNIKQEVYVGGEKVY